MMQLSWFFDVRTFPEKKSLEKWGAKVLGECVLSPRPRTMYDIRTLHRTYSYKLFRQPTLPLCTFVSPFLCTTGVLCGFVPVSPVIKDHSLLRSFSYISVPTLIVHGDRDEEGIDVARKLSRIPSSTPTYIIPNAGQNCFLDQPFLFNSLLNNFVNQLDCNE